MKTLTYTELYHHGILGQKWGVRRWQNSDGTFNAAGKERYFGDGSGENYHKLDSSKEKTSFYKESNKKIKTNPDGSKTIPSGFVFNRVGKETLDVNKSGALYVSHGKEDAARYIKSLGPSPLGKLLNTASPAVQHLSVKSPLKMPSDDQTNKLSCEFMLSNKKALKEINESIYSMAWDKDEISVSDLKKAILNPSSKEATKISYVLSKMLGDSQYKDVSKAFYDHARKDGWDAIPDLHDKLTGASQAPMIVLNTNKVKLDSVTLISKDIYKEGKKYVKSIGKLPVSEALK